MADVPVGFFLSGGVDSSAVVAAAAERHSSLETFAIGFDDAAFDESPFAAQVAAHFDTRHQCQIFPTNWAREHFADLRAWYGELATGITLRLPDAPAHDAALGQVIAALA